MKLRALRILPWHCGHFLTEAFCSELSFSLTRSKHWGVVSDSNEANVHILLLRGVDSDPHNGSIYCHIYGDGTVIFSIWKVSQNIASADDIDPVEYTREKRVAHRDLLAGTHEWSSAISEVRNTFTELRNRFFVAADLLYYAEFNDYSYVFSVYFVEMSESELSSIQKIQPLVMELVVPSDVGRVRAEEDGMAILDITGDTFLKSAFPEQHSMSSSSVRLSPMTQVLCSWASIVVAGRCTSDVVRLVWQLERGVQHAWHLANIIERSLIGCVTANTPGGSLHDIERIHKMSNRLSLNVERFRGVPHGMSREPEIQLYEALRISSRLDEMYERVERLRHLVQERYQSELENRRHGLEAIIGFSIYALAVITGWDAYRRIITEAGISSGEVMIVVTLILGGALLYAFRERRQ